MSSRKDIENLRAEMAAADVEVLRVLEKRARLSKQLGKLSGGVVPSILADRERVGPLEAAASGDLPVESIRQVFRAIFAALSSLERPMRVAFVGAEGSLGYVAARQIFGASVQATGYEAASQALDEAARGRVDFALAPYESSLEGPLIGTIFALKQTDLVIVGQCELSAGISLLSRTGNLSDIEKVYASAQDRVNCQSFLNSRLPRASVLDVRSPWIACQFAAEDHGGAALAHESVGDQHNLSVVLANVGDSPDLRIRYSVIGSRPSPRTGQDMTSIIFTVNDEPGALLNALGHFAERGINVKNVISRPMPGEGWEYLFYIEVVGHVTDRAILSAIEVMKKNTKFLRVLGSYPTHGFRDDGHQQR
jgi:chorismate mutase / prephenate dehydratase